MDKEFKFITDNPLHLQLFEEFQGKQELAKQRAIRALEQLENLSTQIKAPPEVVQQLVQDLGYASHLNVDTLWILSLIKILSQGKLSEEEVFQIWSEKEKLSREIKESIPPLL